MTKHNFLFYCCYFAPGYETGAIRPTKLAKYFYKYKQNIIVLTQTSINEKNKVLLDGVENLEIHRNPVIRKLFINDKGFWFSIQTFNKLKELILKNKIEFLFVSGPPFTPYLTSYYLAKKYNLKLIIDYRDLWYGDPYKIVSIKDLILRLIGRLVEKKIMKFAHKVIFVSKNMLNDQEQIYGKLNNAEIISTGIDREDKNYLNKEIYLNFLKENNLDKKIKVFCYLGTLDHTKCVEDFFFLLSKLPKNLNTKILFIGNNKFPNWKFKKYDIDDLIIFKNSINSSLVKNIIKFSNGSIILGGYEMQRLNRKVFENLYFTNNIFFLGSKNSPSYRIMKECKIDTLCHEDLSIKDRFDYLKLFIKKINSLKKHPIQLEPYFKDNLAKNYLELISR